MHAIINEFGSDTESSDLPALDDVAKYEQAACGNILQTYKQWFLQ